jgi:predicted ABC-type ATPase
MANQDKRILIIAGPNGAGKTTFAREFLPNEADCPAFVNADLIAAGLSPFAPEIAALRAGRLMLGQISAYVRQRRSFAFETTLSGLAYARQIPEWQRLGYWVELFFLALPNADLAVARVAERIKQGGHDVPDKRFAAGLPPAKETSRMFTVGLSMRGPCMTTAKSRQCYWTKECGHE